MCGSATCDTYVPTNCKAHCRLTAKDAKQSPSTAHRAVSMVFKTPDYTLLASGKQGKHHYCESHPRLVSSKACCVSRHKRNRNGSNTLSHSTNPGQLYLFQKVSETPYEHRHRKRAQGIQVFICSTPSRDTFRAAFTEAIMFKSHPVIL